MSCPICKAPILPAMVMCKRDWFLVPVALRDKVWHTFQTSRGSEEHRANLAEAIRYVRALEDEEST